MKQLQKTDFIRGLLRAAVGPDVDVETLAVFEATATSTVPFRGKAGTIFENAVIAPNTLHQLATLANSDNAPLLIDHNMNGTPKGKMFYGEVIPQDNGYTELRTLLYVDPTEVELLAKMEHSTVDEVSIAFLPSKINCSQCGFDYIAAANDDNIIPMLMLECDEGHKIGKDGTHTILNGASELLELSVVSRGAAKNSRIIGQSDSILGKDVQRLAASGLDVNQFCVTASAEKGQNDMDLTDLVTRLSDTKAELAVANRDREAVAEELAEEKGKRATAEKRIEELTQELSTARQEAEEAPSAEERKESGKNKEERDEAHTFLSAQYSAVLTAAGKNDFEVPETVTELIAGIEEHKAELSAIIPTGGKAEGAKTNDTVSEPAPNLAQFKLKN